MIADKNATRHAVHDVQVAADRARAAHENEAAIARYSAALALLGDEPA